MRYASYCQGFYSKGFHKLEIIDSNDLQPLIILESAEPLAAHTNIHQHTHTPHVNVLFI